MRVFLDSSALAKRYIEESESQKVEEILSKADEILINIICLPEVLSALNRLKREHKINSNQYNLCKKALLLDANDLTIYNINLSVLEKSIQIIEKCVIRAMDSLHVASALEADADLFLSFDERQLEAAQKFGLKILKN